jgi:hypothetical protein
LKPRVKICCIRSVAEEALALVSAMPSGLGVIEEERIRQIAAAFRLTSHL